MASTRWARSRAPGSTAPTASRPTRSSSAWSFRSRRPRASSRRPSPVLTPDGVRAVEARAARPGGPSLMERAGRAVAHAARKLAADTGAPILVVAGPGNNGGDAWVAAAHLSETFHPVGGFEVTGGEPKAVEARVARDGFSSRGGKVVNAWPEALHPSLIVDGLLGLGLSRDVDRNFADIIHKINASGAPVLAIDAPSGLDTGSGTVRGSAVRATHTITFLAHKVGLHTAEGIEYRGALELDDLGAADEAQREAKGHLLTPELARAWLAPRRPNSHKGLFGSV